MKILSIALVRTGSDLNEPIPLTVAHDLSSFGFFQRQVRYVHDNMKRNWHGIEREWEADTETMTRNDLFMYSFRFFLSPTLLSL